MFQLHDEKSNKSHSLTGLFKSIGRGEDCDICFVGDDRTSRLHARLEWDGEAWVLVDQGSTNGTFVNSQRISEVKLAPGDLIEIGDNQLRLLLMPISNEISQKKVTRLTPRAAVKSKRSEDATRPVTGRPADTFDPKKK